MWTWLPTEKQRQLAGSQYQGSLLIAIVIAISHPQA